MCVVWSRAWYLFQGAMYWGPFSVLATKDDITL